MFAFSPWWWACSTCLGKQWAYSKLRIQAGLGWCEEVPIRGLTHGGGVRRYPHGRDIWRYTHGCWYRYVPTYGVFLWGIRPTGIYVRRYPPTRSWFEAVYTWGLMWWSTHTGVIWRGIHTWVRGIRYPHESKEYVFIPVWCKKYDKKPKSNRRTEHLTRDLNLN